MWNLTIVKTWGGKWYYLFFNQAAISKFFNYSNDNVPLLNIFVEQLFKLVNTMKLKLISYPLSGNGFGGRNKILRNDLCKKKRYNVVLIRVFYAKN